MGGGCPGDGAPPTKFEHSSASSANPPSKGLRQQRHLFVRLTYEEESGAPLNGACKSLAAPLVSAFSASFIGMSLMGSWNSYRPHWWGRHLQRVCALSREDRIIICAEFVTPTPLRRPHNDLIFSNDNVAWTKTLMKTRSHDNVTHQRPNGTGPHGVRARWQHRGHRCCACTVPSHPLTLPPPVNSHGSLGLRSGTS